MTKYFLHAAAILSSAIVAIGYAGPASADQLSGGARLAQATGEDTMARCQQLSSLYSRHNTNGYARPIEVDAAVEDCRKGNYAAGVAALKRAPQSLADPRSCDRVGALPVNVRRHDGRRREARAFGYDACPSGALSSQRRAAWMVENVRSRRPGRSMALMLLTNSSFPVEPVKMAIGPGVPCPLSDLA